MAKNQKIFDGHSLSLNVGVGKLSGDPATYGQLSGICETNADATGMASLSMNGAVWACSVGGVVTGGTNGAVNTGDKLYYQAAATPKINANSTGGVELGVVLGLSYPYSTPAGTLAVASGGTATVHIKLKTQ